MIVIRNYTQSSCVLYYYVIKQVAGASFNGPLLNIKSYHVREDSICLRKHNPSACMMIHIFSVHTLQLQSQSFLICFVNITLTAKSTLHTSQFARFMAPAAIYHTVIGLEKV